MDGAGNMGEAGGWKLILCLPAYNVEKTLPELMERLESSLNALKGRASPVSAIIVDDGSTDGTRRILSDYASRLPWLSPIFKDKNEGPAPALFDAMKEAARVIKEKSLPPERAIIIRMDSDLEHQPEDFPAVLEPVMSGKSEVSAGYIPFDSRNGCLFERFNKFVGVSESREFLGMEIPQFCPGLNAMRGDAFIQILPELLSLAGRFRKKYLVDMLTLDFVILCAAKRLGKNITPVKLTPIPDRHIKRPPLGKLFYYWGYHEKTVEFLRRIRKE